MSEDQMLTNWINNRACDSRSRDLLEVGNPASGTVLARAPKGSADDVDQAVTAARRAASPWAAAGPVARCAQLRDAADRLAAATDEIAKLLVAENGKPLREAAAEVNAAVGMIRSYAELAVHLRSGAQQPPTGELNFQYRQARGVAACIVPWNFPVALAVENTVPNLAVGNTVVLKPSEKTPMATRRLVEVAFGHLPAGVCSVLLGDGAGAGQHLVAHPEVDVVVFVGSEQTGRRIAEVCGRDLRKTVVELGGKDAFVVDESAEIAKAVGLAVAAKYTASGQICTSPEQFCVHERVYDQFVEELAARSSAMRLGDGMDPSTEMGPLIDDEQCQKVTRHVDEARQRGALVVCGGHALDTDGFFYAPTVLTGVPDDAALWDEETFGPVAPVVPFADFEAGVAAANRSAYGLAATVCTESAPNALYAIEHLGAGMVKVNTLRGKAPGGTSEPFKASGLGHGYGVEFLHELTRQKSVHWRARLA